MNRNIDIFDVRFNGILRSLERNIKHLAHNILNGDYSGGAVTLKVECKQDEQDKNIIGFDYTTKMSLKKDSSENDYVILPNNEHLIVEEGQMQIVPSDQLNLFNGNIIDFNDR